MWQWIVRLVHANETELFPIRLRLGEIRRRQCDLQKIATQRSFSSASLAGREGARFDEPDRLAGRIEPAEFVEYMTAEAAAFESHAQRFERLHSFEQVGFDEGHRRCADRILMQP